MLCNLSTLFRCLEVRSFYWNSVCQTPLGSCERIDHFRNSKQSTLNVADRTAVEFDCCATVIGYGFVDVRMNSVGFNRDLVNIERTLDEDGSTVVCAHQHTSFRLSPRPVKETLTCELYLDQKFHSRFTSSIIVTGSSLLLIQRTSLLSIRLISRRHSTATSQPASTKLRSTRAPKSTDADVSPERSSSLASSTMAPFVMLTIR
jgi:hypothetical protein